MKNVIKKVRVFFKLKLEKAKKLRESNFFKKTVKTIADSNSSFWEKTLQYEKMLENLSLTSIEIINNIKSLQIENEQRLFFLKTTLEGNIKKHLFMDTIFIIEDCLLKSKEKFLLYKWVIEEEEKILSKKIHPQSEFHILKVFLKKEEMLSDEDVVLFIKNTDKKLFTEIKTIAKLYGIKTQKKIYKEVQKFYLKEGLISLFLETKIILKEKIKEEELYKVIKNYNGGGNCTLRIKDFDEVKNPEKILQKIKEIEFSIQKSILKEYKKMKA